MDLQTFGEIVASRESGETKYSDKFLNDLIVEKMHEIRALLDDDVYFGEDEKLRDGVNNEVKMTREVKKLYKYILDVRRLMYAF